MREGEDFGQVGFKYGLSQIPRSDDGIENPQYDFVDRPLSSEFRSITEEEKSDANLCRICFESGETLLHPCKCAGSVRYIHENCLKAWLTSHAEDVSKSECELCHTPYRMKTLVKRKCAPTDACKEGLAPCLFVPLLISIFGLLVVIVYLLADRYLNRADTGEQRGYAGALIGVCVVCMLVIGFLVVRSLREACCSRKLLEWIILNNEDQPSRDAKVVPVVDQTTNVEVRGDEEEKVAEPPIFVFPKRITVNGVQVPTPELTSPSLTPVQKKGRVVAATPRVFVMPSSLAESRVMSPIGQRVLQWPESVRAANLNSSKSAVTLNDQTFQ